MDQDTHSPHARRLTRQLVRLAHTACDVREPVVAFRMLGVAETLLRSAALDPRDRLGLADLIVATHGRLWHLRHPEEVASNAGAPLPAGLPLP